MDNWSETQQRRVGTYERNLHIKKLADMEIPYEVIGGLQKPKITKQRVCQILQELEKAREKLDREWDTVRDGYGGEAKYE